MFGARATSPLVQIDISIALNQVFGCSVESKVQFNRKCFSASATLERLLVHLLACLQMWLFFFLFFKCRLSLLVH